MTERHDSLVPHGGQGDNYSPAPRDAYSGPPMDRWESFDDEGGVSIGHHLTAVFRFKWIVIVAAVLGIGGAYAAWNIAEPQYVAEGSLWIRGANPQGTGPITSSSLLPAQSWMDLLRSYAVLDPVVYSEKLYIRPANPADYELLRDLEINDGLVPGGYVLMVSEDGGTATLLRGDEVVDTAAPGERIGQESGFEWVLPTAGLQPGAEIEFSLTTPRSAAVTLQQDIVPQMNQAGQSFITIRLAGPDAERTAAVVNGVMENHVALAAELKRGTLDEEEAILQEQLETAGADLADAERALETFRVQTITLPSEDSRAAPIQPGLEMTRDPVTQRYFDMRIRQEEVEQNLERLRDVAARLSSGEVPIEALEMNPALVDATQLSAALQELVTAQAERRSLETRYTPEHPTVQEVSDRIRTLEEERIPSLLSQFIQQLESEQDGLAGRIAGSEADLTEIPPRAIEEGRLRRQVQIQEQLYTEVEGRYQMARLARATSQPDVEILDRAIPPQSPQSDPRPVVALAVFGTLLGLGLASALAAGILDSRLRTPEEIESAFGLSILGAIPRIRGDGTLKGSSTIGNVGQVYEAFRELRTNLTYAYGAAGPLILTVSSPGMEEGKTTITTNLGISFAELGRRTLIIDADTRRGDLHRFLGGQRKPGLTDYLMGDASGEEVLQDTPREMLQFIGSGTHVSNSPELLSSREMSRMMSALREKYEVILVDSPPLGAGSDALVLGSITGHLLLVVRSGATDRDFTQAKLEPLHRLPVRMLGAVLNDYQPSRLASDQYKYYGTYLPGYEAREEESSASGTGDDVTARLPAGAGAGRFGSGEKGTSG